MDLASFASFLLALAIVVGALLLVLLGVNTILRHSRQRQPRLWRGWLRVRQPLSATVLVTGIRITYSPTAPEFGLRGMVAHALLIGAIASGMWLAATLVLYLIDASQSKITDRKSSDLQRRRAQTQFRLIRRLVSVVFVVLAVAMTLLTFPGVERVGTGLFASAGLLSLVAGLAAQSSLANLFAGIQLTFSDAIRLDDVVEVDGEWGTIEDITLSYVVVKIWDERRLVLPTTYFTTTPYKNWTRNGTQIVGTVKFELDFGADIHGMRRQLDQVLESTDLWDGRSHSLVVTDSVADRLTVRVAVSAANSGHLWSLQCLIREELASWIYSNNPDALGHDRVQFEPADEEESHN